MEASDSKEKETVKKTYGKIVLTLENALLSSEKLDSEQGTVSQQDGLERSIELDLRFLGCELIQTAGILLKLPQVWKKNSRKTFRAMFAIENVFSEFPRLIFNDVPICYLCSGRHGFRTSAFPAILLFQIIRSSRFWGNCYGLYLLGIENRRSTTTTPRCPERVQPHQTNARSKVSIPPPIHFFILTQFINLFINQFCR